MCICSRLEGMVRWVFDDVFVGLWTWSVVTAQQTRWVTDTTQRCHRHNTTVLWQTQHGVVSDTAQCFDRHSTVLWHTCCVHSIINWVNRAWKHTSTFFWKRVYRFPAMVFQHSSMHCQCLKCGWAVMDGVQVLIFMAGCCQKFSFRSCFGGDFWRAAKTGSRRCTPVTFGRQPAQVFSRPRRRTQSVLTQRRNFWLERLTE